MLFTRATGCNCKKKWESILDAQQESAKLCLLQVNCTQTHDSSVQYGHLIINREHGVLPFQEKHPSSLSELLLSPALTQMPGSFICVSGEQLEPQATSDELFRCTHSHEETQTKDVHPVDCLLQAEGRVRADSSSDPTGHLTPPPSVWEGLKTDLNSSFKWEYTTAYRRHDVQQSDPNTDHTHAQLQGSLTPQHYQETQENTTWNKE